MRWLSQQSACPASTNNWVQSPDPTFKRLARVKQVWNPSVGMGYKTDPWSLLTEEHSIMGQWETLSQKARWTVPGNNTWGCSLATCTWTHTYTHRGVSQYWEVPFIGTLNADVHMCTGIPHMLIHRYAQVSLMYWCIGVHKYLSHTDAQVGTCIMCVLIYRCA